MARHYVWFGTEEYMTWVPAPAADSSTYQRSSWRTSGSYLNGGAYSVQSPVGAMRVDLTWNPMPRQDVDLLRAFFDGAYGPGPFYYADPFGGENILPQWLSMPYLNLEGGPGFRKPNHRINASIGGIPVGSNPWGYPARGATYYAADPLNPNMSWKIPVPPNNNFHLGVRGDLDDTAAPTSATVRLNGDPVQPLDIMDGLRFSASVSGGVDGAWATISLNQMGGKTAIVQSLMGAYNGSEGVKVGGLFPSYGRFIPGRGYGALRLAEDPQITRYSSVLDRESISASFVEAYPWER